jgi:hypothetical protein
MDLQCRLLAASSLVLAASACASTVTAEPPVQVEQPTTSAPQRGEPPVLCTPPEQDAVEPMDVTCAALLDRHACRHAAREAPDSSCTAALPTGGTRTFAAAIADAQKRHADKTWDALSVEIGVCGDTCYVRGSGLGAFRESFDRDGHLVYKSSGADAPGRDGCYGYSSGDRPVCKDQPVTRMGPARP